MTPEVVFCVSHGISGNGRRHIVRTVRERDSTDGAATFHAHPGTTLCGARAWDVTPFVPPCVLTMRGQTGCLAHDRCEDCCDLYLEAAGKAVGVACAVGS